MLDEKGPLGLIWKVSSHVVREKITQQNWWGGVYGNLLLLIYLLGINPSGAQSTVHSPLPTFTCPNIPMKQVDWKRLVKVTQSLQSNTLITMSHWPIRQEEQLSHRCWEWQDIGSQLTFPCSCSVTSHQH